MTYLILAFPDLNSSQGMGNNHRNRAIFQIEQNLQDNTLRRYQVLSSGFKKVSQDNLSIILTK